MNYYIADMHLSHSNIINTDGRPFNTVEEMNTTLVRNWNARVNNNDNVYIVGDFCFNDSVKPEYYLEKLKGRKHFIIGNHDKATLNSPKALEYFESIDKMMHINDNGAHIVLCHFPLAEWNGFYRNAWHIYGHIHGNKNETYEIMSRRPRALNAGCMINNYMPVTFNELIVNNEIFQNKKIKMGTKNNIH